MQCIGNAPYVIIIEGYERSLFVKSTEMPMCVCIQCMSLLGGWVMLFDEEWILVLVWKEQLFSVLPYVSL